MGGPEGGKVQHPAAIAEASTGGAAADGGGAAAASMMMGGGGLLQPKQNAPPPRPSSLPPSSSSYPVFLFHLAHLSRLPPVLLRLLCHEGVRKVGIA